MYLTGDNAFVLGMIDAVFATALGVMFAVDSQNLTTLPTVVMAWLLIMILVRFNSKVPEPEDKK